MQLGTLHKAPSLKIHQAARLWTASRLFKSLIRAYSNTDLIKKKTRKYPSSNRDGTIIRWLCGWEVVSQGPGQSSTKQTPQ